MNANKYLNSRLGITIEKIKVAYMAGKNIIFLVTTDMDIVKGIVESGSFLPFVQFEEGLNPSKMYKYANWQEDFFPINKDNPVLGGHPMLYIYQLGNYNPETEKMNPMASGFPAKSLRNYVKLREKLEDNVSKEQMKHIERSLILIVVDNVISIPTYIAPYAEMVVVPYMGKEEFYEFVSKIINEEDGIQLTTTADGYHFLNDVEYLRNLFSCLRGMDKKEIEAILKKNKALLGRVYFSSASDDDRDGVKKMLSNIRKEAQKIISNSAALTLVPVSIKKPAGMEGIEEWLKKYKDFISKPDACEEISLVPPKGILVTGIPGTGKSMMAKYIAHLLELSLVKFDFGDVLGGFVGDSEKNMNKALALIDALSPCVVWVDEMEKAFSGANGPNTHEVTKRLIGKFLTWMQEKENSGASSFIFATANDIGKMPPEMFRSGRFNEKFYTFMPSAEECACIFERCLIDQNEDYKPIYYGAPESLFDITKINKEWFMSLLNNVNKDKKKEGKKLKFFIGSDIAQMVEKAKVEYIGKNKPEGLKYKFDTDCFKKCLEEAARNIRSYGETNLYDIVSCYSQLSKYNFLPASGNHEILPFEGYDELRYKKAKQSGKTDVKLYELPNNNNGSTCEYDLQLIETIKDTINGLANDLIK